MVQNSKLAGFIVLGGGIIAAQWGSVYKMIRGMQKLGLNLTCKQYHLQAEKWERRTSDEKFVSTKPRGAEARSGCANWGANFSSVRPSCPEEIIFIIALRQFIQMRDLKKA
jgi:hypothetical protein